MHIVNACDKTIAKVAQTLLISNAGSANRLFCWQWHWSAFLETAHKKLLRVVAVTFTLSFDVYSHLNFKLKFRQWKFPWTETTHTKYLISALEDWNHRVWHSWNIDVLIIICHLCLYHYTPNCHVTFPACQLPSKGWFLLWICYRNFDAVIVVLISASLQYKPKIFILTNNYPSLSLESDVR